MTIRYGHGHELAMYVRLRCFAELGAVWPRGSVATRAEP